MEMQLKEYLISDNDDMVEFNISFGQYQNGVNKVDFSAFKIQDESEEISLTGTSIESLEKLKIMIDKVLHYYSEVEDINEED